MYDNSQIPALQFMYSSIEDPDVKVLAIATRPDCLDSDVLELLDELNQIKPGNMRYKHAPDAFWQEWLSLLRAVL